MRRSIVLLLVAPLVLAPPVRAEAKGPVFVQGWTTCDEDLAGIQIPQVPCYLYAEANLTMLPCEGTICPYYVDSGAYMTAHIPNLLWMETVVANGASACFAARYLEEWNTECGWVCDTLRVGWSAYCEGNTSAFNPGIRWLRLAVGDCDSVSVVNAVTWGYMAEVTHLIFRYDVCRTSEGAFAIEPYISHPCDDVECPYTGSRSIT